VAARTSGSRGRGFSTTESVTQPAGTYDITMMSYDAHDEHPGQTDQTQEQWYFELDSGYVSAPTIDIADDTNASTTTLTAQVIGASSTITVRHLGAGNVNSVDVVCVGFTPSATPETAVSDDDPVAAPTEPTEPPVADIADPATVIRKPPPPPIDVEVRGVVETPPPTQVSSQPPSATLVQLALTGPNDLAYTLSLTALAMLALGTILLASQRRL